MKIIIEIAGGCVSGVYYRRATPQGRIPDVYVVDLDGAEVGESTAAVEIAVEPLDDASDITKESLDWQSEARAKAARIETLQKIRAVAQAAEMVPFDASHPAYMPAQMEHGRDEQEWDICGSGRRD